MGGKVFGECGADVPGVGLGPLYAFEGVALEGAAKLRLLILLRLCRYCPSFQSE